MKILETFSESIFILRLQENYREPSKTLKSPPFRRRTFFCDAKFVNNVLTCLWERDVSAPTTRLRARDTEKFWTRRPRRRLCLSRFCTATRPSTSVRRLAPRRFELSCSVWEIYQTDAGGAVLTLIFKIGLANPCGRISESERIGKAPGQSTESAHMPENINCMRKNLFFAPAAWKTEKRLWHSDASIFFLKLKKYWRIF